MSPHKYHLFFSSSHPLFISLILIIILGDTNQLIRYCSSAKIDESCTNNLYQCGNITASFPFWGNGRPENCGYSADFKLTCQNNISSITISKQTYNVLSIVNSSQTINLALMGISQGICPAQSTITNMNFNFLPLFNFTSASRNITLYYDCSNIGQGLPSNFKVSCSGNRDFYVFEPVSGAQPGLCSSSIVVPVLGESVNGFWSNPTTASALDEVLKKGFQLRWLVDENTPAPPPAGKKKKKVGAPIGIAIGATFGIVLVIFLFFFIYRKRRENKLKTPSSSSTPILPSSSTPILSRSTISSESASSKIMNMDSEKGSINKLFGVQIFSYNELEEATNSFDGSKELGDGGFGTVYHGILKDGRHVAVKRLFENNMKRLEQFMNEVDLLTRLRHQNLVALYGSTSHQSRELLLVYEFIANGTIADHLHGKRAKPGLLKWPIRMDIAIETASALSYLHASDVIHRDVKTTNILLDQNFRVKVADFGLSRLFPLNVTHVSTAPQGTPGYVDPEYYQCYQLTDKSDVYSFGVVLVELISSKPAVDTNRDRYEINLATMAVNKIRNGDLQDMVDPHIGFESDYAVRRMIISVAELAFRCLQQQREMRPSMVEILEVLRGIKSEVYNVKKADEVDILEDDVVF